MKTITGRTIKVSSNQAKKIFTIITESGKYRTIKMTKEEFNSMLYNTANDWQYFLRTSPDYYKIN